MTAVVSDEPDSWTTPAGWGIYADLTPPELLNGRKLHRIRRMLIAALVIAVLVVLAAFGYSLWLSRKASADLAQQTTRNAQITAEQGRYAAVTAVQSTAAQFRNELHGLMATDVEFGSLLGSIREAQPKTVGVTALQVTVNSAAASVAAGGASGGAAAAGSGSLATSGVTPIGSVTISGTVGQLRSLQLYIIALQAIPGIVDVIPGTLTSSGGAYTFSLAMSIDARALTGRYVAVVGAPVAAVGP